MIKKGIYKLSIIQGIALIALLISCQTEIPNKSEKIEFLSGVGIPLDRIDPGDSDFSDLDFLKGILEDVDVVMLGEISHTDGSSLEAKSRIVKFLHQQMGFDVLVFESGLFECNYAWEELLREGVPPDTAFARGVFPVWASSAYVHDLVQYIGKMAKTGNPLELAGMDIQLTGNISIATRRKLYHEHLHAVDSNLSFSQFTRLIDLFDNPKKYFPNSQKVDQAQKDSVFAELVQIEAIFSKADLSAKENLIYHRHFQNLQRFLYFTWNLDYNDMDPVVANIRDEEMGKNLIWLKEELYPNKKIIVWGANSHLLHNRKLLEKPDEMHPMGEYVKERYGDRCYVIGLSCYGGELGSIMKDYTKKVPMASNKSMEYLLHEAGFEYAFFNMKTLQPGTVIGKQFVARFLGYSNLKADWGSMFDGFLFIDEMKPNSRINTRANE